MQTKPDENLSTALTILFCNSSRNIILYLTIKFQYINVFLSTGYPDEGINILYSKLILSKN